METTRTKIRIKRVKENDTVWFAAYKFITADKSEPKEIFIKGSCAVVGKDYATEKECQEHAIRVAKGETKSETVVAEFTI